VNGWWRGLLYINKICIAYSVYIFSFKSMKEGHDHVSKVVAIIDELARIIGDSYFESWMRMEAHLLACE